MSSEQIEIAIIQIIEELLVIKRKYGAREKRIWVKKWIKRRNQFGASNTLLKELAVEDPKSYFNFLRINEEMFNTLLEKVRLRIQKQDTMMRCALPPKLKLEVTLRYLATGDSFKTLQYISMVKRTHVLCKNLCIFQEWHSKI
ncbi:uncharacterized protein LOC132935891 [Metopolophium dirhodum]|uniref:uncharacterized protein LOC132935891 n=1 Tax=Metopolophium dirhodum TaxID=44670 RepID=UPI00298F9C8E|nr:uncharacterized protein LOC132935891 [Metopolophium dirhodum]